MNILQTNEKDVRAECRRQYILDGTLSKPQWVVSQQQIAAWQDEAGKIVIEEFLSALY